jgi:hypothetical protein
MKLDKAIEIKQKYQYILQDASFPELIEADNLSIEALKRLEDMRISPCTTSDEILPGEDPQ